MTLLKPWFGQISAHEKDSVALSLWSKIEHEQFCKALRKKEIMTYAISKCVNFVPVTVVQRYIKLTPKKVFTAN